MEIRIREVLRHLSASKICPGTLTILFLGYDEEYSLKGKSVSK